jgi:hypothetical protein
MAYAGQVPAVVASGLICLAIGAGGGVLTMMLLGYEKKETEPTPEEVQAAAKEMMGKGNDPQAVIGGGGGMMGKGGGGGGMMGKGGGGGGMMGKGGGGMGGGMAKGGGGMAKGGGGGFGPSPKTQLAQLVAKLDVLTEKPLSIDLTDDQRAKVREQIKGLASAEELSDDEATKRMNAMLEVLKDQKATLEAAGYRWPGEGGGAGGFERGFLIL